MLGGLTLLHTTVKGHFFTASYSFVFVAKSFIQTTHVKQSLCLFRCYCTE